MSFKVISYGELWRPLCSLKQNDLCNFVRGHYWKPSCEVILNLSGGSGLDGV